jgi:phage terminase large subunit-like protein
MNIDRALTNKRMLGAALGDTVSWTTWLTVLRAAFGLPLDEQQTNIFASVAGARTPPAQRVRELWCVIGRRGGKSRIAAALSVYFALFTKHKRVFGERVMVLVLSASVEQSKTVFGYVRGFLDAAPSLAREVVSSTAGEIQLRTASSSPCTVTVSAPCAAAPWSRASLTKCLSGAMRARLYPTPKLTLPCYRR